MSYQGKMKTRAAWVIFTAAAIVYVTLALKRLPRPQVDFQIYQFCAQTYRDSPAPYQRDDFRAVCFYPPASNYLFGRWLADGGAAAGLIWATVTIVAAALSLALALRLARATPTVVAIAAIAFVSDPFADAAAFGNISPVIALGVFLALLAIERGHGFVGGVLLGLSAIAKLYPLYLAGWLLVAGMRQRRRAMMIAGSLAVTMFAAAQIAPHSFAFWQFTAGDGFTTAVVGRGTNNAIPALFDRLGFVVSPLALLVVFGAPIGWRLFARPTTLVVDASLCLLLIFLTAPVVWPHTYTLMTLPLLVAAVDLARGWSNSEGNRLRALGLVYCGAVFLRAEHFAVGNDAIALIGLILAVSASLVLAVLLWKPHD